MIFNTTEFYEEVLGAISLSSSSFVGLSAFIKRNAIERPRFENALHGKSVTLIARWQKSDLLSGASDLDLYELCRERGWKFGIDLNLHGKVFLIDSKQIFLGSANITQSGLNDRGTGNHEFGVQMVAVQADIIKLNEFISSEVTWMTDELYGILKREVDDSKKADLGSCLTSWSSQVASLIFKPVKFVWVNECLFSSPESIKNKADISSEVIHDRALLGISFYDIDDSSLRSSFVNTNVFRWFVALLTVNESLSFGGVTAALHASLLDDPRPYRLEVKRLCQILFEWAEFMTDIFEVSRPSYSSVIRLHKS